MAKLPETSESMISMIFIVMNMKKIMQEYYFVFVRFFIILAKIIRKMKMVRI